MKSSIFLTNESVVPLMQTTKPSDFRAVAENLPDVICRYDENYYHLYVNPAMERVTGIPQQVFLGKTPYELGMPDAFAELWVTHIRKVFTTSQPTTIEFTFPSSNGMRYFQSLLVPEFDPKGTVLTVLSISRDITHLKLEEKRKQEFFGIVSHELKTPVTSLKAFAQTLEHRFKKTGDEKNAGYLSKMNQQLDKLTNLITDLLDVTKIEGGNLVFKEEVFSIKELIDEVVESVQRTTKHHNIRIEKTIKKKLVGDRNRVGQVLMNLLSNAIKYAPANSEIVVKASSEEDSVKICVRDSGQGIPEEFHGKVFDQFYRIEGSKKDTYPGLGLGLYISSEIVKRQGGKVWVESTPGQGATFCFTLPLKIKESNKRQN